MAVIVQFQVQRWTGSDWLECSEFLDLTYWKARDYLTEYAQKQSHPGYVSCRYALTERVFVKYSNKTHVHSAIIGTYVWTGTCLIVEHPSISKIDTGRQAYMLELPRIVHRLVNNLEDIEAYNEFVSQPKLLTDDNLETHFCCIWTKYHDSGLRSNQPSDLAYAQMFDELLGLDPIICLVGGEEFDD